MAVTIIDVAKHAGVSKTTVSAVLCDKMGVSEGTRQKVLTAVKELGYIPNLTARNFVQRRTNILGALILTSRAFYHNYEFTNETGVFSQDVINGIIKGLVSTGYGLLTEYYIPSEEAEYPVMVQDSRIDGLFVIGATPLKNKITKLLKRREIPVISIGHSNTNGISIQVNVQKSIYLATEHMILKGHKRICLINCASIFASSKERLKGFYNAMEKYQGVVYDSLVIHSENNSGIAGYNAISEIYKRVEKGEAPMPDGIIGANVSITMGILRYLYDRNIRVPYDVSLIGHEDSAMYGFSAPALSATNIKKEMMGETAVKMMIAEIDNKKPIENTEIYFEPVFRERDSVRKR